MAEELKALIDVLADLPGSALWAAGGFLIWKVVHHLSTVGAVCYIVKLILDKFPDKMTFSFNSKEPKPKPWGNGPR